MKQSTLLRAEINRLVDHLENLSVQLYIDGDPITETQAEFVRTRNELLQAVRCYAIELTMDALNETS